MKGELLYPAGADALRPQVAEFALARLQEGIRSFMEAQVTAGRVSVLEAQDTLRSLDVAPLERRKWRVRIDVSSTVVIEVVAATQEGAEAVGQARITKGITTLNGSMLPGGARISSSHLSGPAFVAEIGEVRYGDQGGEVKG